MSRPSAAALGVLPPRTVIAGSLEITRLLGYGGMGIVYEAFDHVLRRVVALKAPRRTSDGAAVVAEGRALAAIRHPGVVAVHTLVAHAGTPFLVMERLAGSTLAAHVDRHRENATQVPIARVLEIAEAVADALAVVHDAGIAHCDVKPANVVLAGRRIVLTDFGLVIPEYAAATHGRVSGSPTYMAPEISTVGVRSGEAHLVDLYALGIMLFELLAGAPPFVGDTSIATLVHHARDPIPDVRSTRPDAPGALVEIVEALLAKKAHDRPTSAQDVAERIRAIPRRADGRRGVHVLVCEDDPATLEVQLSTIRQTMPDAGVHAATSAEEALAWASHQALDLVVTDLSLPGMNGVELCMALNATRAHPSIVATSAYADAADVELLGRFGVAGFVPKGDGYGRRLTHALAEWSHSRR